MEEPGGLQSMGSLESDPIERLHFHFHALEKEMAPTPVFLPGESQGREAWWAAVHEVTKSQTQLKQLSTHAQGHCFSCPLTIVFNS